MDEAEKELYELAEGLDIEEELTQEEWKAEEGDNEDEVDQGDDDNEISMTDHEELEENIRPVWMLLVKVSVAQCN